MKNNAIRTDGSLVPRTLTFSHKVADGENRVINLQVGQLLLRRMNALDILIDSGMY